MDIIPETTLIPAHILTTLTGTDTDTDTTIIANTPIWLSRHRSNILENEKQRIVGKRRRRG
jgi:hypothetical protein